MKQNIRSEVVFCMIVIGVLLIAGIVFGVLAKSIFSNADESAPAEVELPLEENPNVKISIKEYQSVSVTMWIDVVKHKLLKFQSTTTSYVIPVSVALDDGTVTYIDSIGDSVFENNTYLTQIVLSGIQKIGKKTFKNCTQLVTVDAIYLTTMGESSFQGCSKLKTVRFPELTAIADSAFAGCSLLGIDTSAEQETYSPLLFPKVSTVGISAFRGCAGLKAIELPLGRSIGEFAFYENTSLKRVTAPILLKIDGFAFANCTNLLSFNSVEAGNYNLGTVKNIVSYNAFLNCFLLEKVYLNSITNLGFNSFQGCIALQTVYMPSEKTSQYGNSSYFNNFWNHLSFYEPPVS